MKEPKAFTGEEAIALIDVFGYAVAHVATGRPSKAAKARFMRAARALFTAIANRPPTEDELRRMWE